MNAIIKKGLTATMLQLVKAMTDADFVDHVVELVKAAASLTVTGAETQR